MQGIFNRFFRCGLIPVVCMTLWFSGSLSRSADEIDPSSYPGMGDAELSQLRWALHLADRPLDDFRDMEGIDQRGMTAYRYCIAFMTYFMALEQYHKLPACPEIIQPRMDRLNRKMLLKPVWEFWAEVSQGLPNLEPKLNKPYPEERDPVAKRNIMYSGHVGQMLGLYQMLYRDLKWDKPGSIVFKWSDDEKFIYDAHSLNKVMYEQMKHHPAHCIECEPNACFPECNQHPILSFMLHDGLHGTNFFDASEEFMNFFLEKQMIHPRTHETAMLYLIKQDLTLSNQNPHYKNALDLIVTPAVSLGIVSIDSASADGWTGAFMHAWQPEYIERNYPYQKENNLVNLEDEQARLAWTIWEPQLKYGFFAMLAAEVGDIETRDKLIAFADKKYEPVLENGMLRYPYSLSKGSTNLTGKLLACARAMSENGFHRMHNRPFDDAHFKEPKVTNVDFPNVLLRRAIYDRDRKALIVTTGPGAAGQADTSLKIERLDPSATYLLTIDGKQLETVQGREAIDITVSLDRGHDIVLRVQ